MTRGALGEAPDAVDREPATRAQWAEHQLRARIVSGELEPGSRVLVEELAARWEVSSTPVREALRTLAGEGLITLSPQRGARVAEVSPTEMEDVYATRLMFEPYALRLSLERGGQTWEESLTAAWRALEMAQRRKPRTPLDLEPAHTEFHRALVDACGSPWLLRIVGQLATQSLRFRILTSAARPGGLTAAHAEHAELYRACIAREQALALELTAAHIGRTIACTLGADALGRMTERIRLAHGIGAPVLAGLARLD